jgi:hypothetical protein
MGSLYSLSPAQIQQSRRIDQRSDLWSLAVILFRAVTGKLPFTGDEAGFVIMQILTSLTPEPTTINPSLPPALDAFFRRAFQRAPGARFQSVREMTHAFVEATRGASAPCRSRCGWGIEAGRRLGGMSRSDVLAIVAAVHRFAGAEDDAVVPAVGSFKRRLRVGRHWVVMLLTPDGSVVRVVRIYPTRRILPTPHSEAGDRV